MTWYYELDEANDRIRLRFEDDGGAVHGPLDVDWPNAPTLSIAPDGWVVEPDLKEEAGIGATDLYTLISEIVALQALRDLAAGKVRQGVP